MRFTIPTTLSLKDNQTLRELYKLEYDKEISPSKADQEAYRLMNFLAVLVESTTAPDQSLN
ncbi:MAG: hypothetical protein JJ975_01015 [Bacteroidia bacterium]|nr:hypothetical protein [Bacteroidia bacterium]